MTKQNVTGGIGGSLRKNEGAAAEMTESELISDIAEFQPMLFRLAYSYTGSRADCDDIVQEVFIKLFFRGRGFKSREEKKAWLIRVTVNLCKNHLSAWWRKKREALPEDPEENFPPHAAEEAFSDSGYDELSAALRRLKPMYRAVIHLHYYEGFSVAETAEILKISVSAVTTRLQRGREMLRNMLTD